MKQANESGYTLISVLLVFLLFTILGVSLTSMSLSSVTASKTEQNHQSAFYIAEAGLNYKYHNIKHELENNPINSIDEWEQLIDDINVKPIVSFDDEDKLNHLQLPGSDEVYADTHVQRLPDVSEHAFEIISTGHQDEQSRTVKQIFTLNFNEDQGDKYELPPVVALTNGKLNTIGGHVIGNIATHSTEPGSVEFNYATLDKESKIYVPSDAPESVIKKTDYRNDLPNPNPIDESWIIPELPDFPDIPQLQASTEENIILSGNDTKEIILDKSLSFNNISLSADTSLTINTGSTDKEIVVDNLNIPQGHIKLEGTGDLTIYVTNELTVSGSSTINEYGDINQLNIYLQGSTNNNQQKSFTAAGDVEIYGSLYAEDANITLNGSGNIQGNIFTGGQELNVGGYSTNNTQLLFVPYGEDDFFGSGNLRD